MKVGFTGTQDGMTKAQEKALGYILRQGHGTLDHGDCIGSDAQAHYLALSFLWRVRIHPPLNPRKRAFCNGDGFFDAVVEILEPKDYIPRNHDIVDDTDMLIATPKEFKEQLRSGTWSTIRYARRQHKKIIIIYPDGRREPG